MIAAGQQKRAHGDGVTGARHHHRFGVGQEAIRQLEAAPEHVDRGLHFTGGEDLQVEASAEYPAITGDHQRPNIITVRVVDRCIEGLLHRRAQCVDLAVVHTDDGDGILAGIADRVAHALD
ncbi:Uncharacterised protein [Mycobacterium tuberculosis]|uniref:Uncharacterized protein n=1 Tax=Mycobacterium tuberculosis TaxID=1773 RepID=A0A916PAG9_MYCTX|nr:Uncharacterised protein [Mycobacterium tuberculosis]CKT07705.1 Uncharacterised protein [Mycobacterium tuberculosis]COW85160.1 Uncharacterised protein [Mycobacterium tuberculosis]COX00485.1 Uncharacterised protein [Mycobacterium tuberculosis]COY47174.1 Uncharacterised protein [Mycobacterium tuberculosis]